MTEADSHEYVMEPLAGMATNLEVAIAYIRQVVRNEPTCTWPLNRALIEIEEARRGIKATQRRAVERWRNNFH